MTPLVVTAQSPAKTRTIGFLSLYTAPYLKTRLEAFKEGLGNLGYVIGKNIVIEERHADGRLERLGALATELTQLPLDVLVAHGSSAPNYAKRTTSSIPIVFIAHPDPVGLGTVASLSRPGGNVTGLSDLHGDLVAKRLELLKETLPSVSRIAGLWDPDNPSQRPQLKAMQAAASVLGVTVIPIAIVPKDLDRIFTSVKAGRVNALATIGGSGGIHGKEIAALALRHQVPTIVTTKEAVIDNGFLMSYGTNHPDLYRRAATYVDKILKGAKPADLPVEQPTKFELIVNLRIAKQIGVTIPGNVLTRADEVIK